MIAFDLGGEKSFNPDSMQADPPPSHETGTPGSSMRSRLVKTVFVTLLTLSLILGWWCFASARFGPFRGTFLDLWPGQSHALKGALIQSYMHSLIGFGLVWLASPDLRFRYRWLSPLALAPGLLALALPS
jgi:hypothetical protein